MSRCAAVRAATLFLLVVSSITAQETTRDPFSGLRWRSIGPFRGGRIRALAGVPQQPYTFYFAQVNGGVWKTTDAGRTWFPIFDDQPTQSIGAIAVAPSDPSTIYVGSGEGLQRPDLSVGDGIYRSTDAGKSWTHLDLRDAQQIPQIAVDPTNANRLFVAALGHPYGPNKERGIYRSTNGGQSFEPVLQKDENVGGNDVDIDPSNPQIVFANLWESRQGPWENAVWVGNGGGLFKSTDGGNTWKLLSNGLPNNVNQVNLTIAPTHPRRLYATVASNGPPPTVGIYRSDDSGESWTRITSDTRPAGRIGGGDLPVPSVHPKDPETVIMASTVSWKSSDGGRTWAPYKGAPGGEDYQGVWINPNDPNIVFLVADQGAVVTLNGGETWSAWYNQPTAQLYHVAADNAFPYRVCSGQQESGSACVASRGNYGAISVRDWLPVGVDEYGYVAPHPMNPDLVFGGRAVTRFDRRTGQVSIVGPLAGRTFAPGTSPYRQVRTQPVVFSEADKRTLFFGNNVLWKTTDGGITWKQVSPDVTRKTWDVPASVGKYSRDTTLVRQRGVIYTIGPSPLNANRIWFGTDDGLIYTTSDGGTTWRDVTPRQIGPWWKVFMIDPGRFDTATAYAAVNTLRLDDMRAHFYKTHDGGRTWADIGHGTSDMGTGPANAIREDPKKKGLLYAATEKGVYVSFNDGDSWQSLRLNLPATSVRDLIVKDDDIVVATHGRGFWILDDITPLRQLAPNTLERDVVLFRPQPALRVRWNTSTDMPWPKEEPVGENPPDGASINYYLRNTAAGPITLEIRRRDGRVVRRYASDDSLPWTIPSDATAPYPTYWYRQPPRLSARPGMHRFHWDVHYQPLPITLQQGFGGGAFGLPIGAIPRHTAPAPRAPWVSPGTYTVRLTVDGKTYTQPITVRQDPRVRTPVAPMRVLYALTDSMYFIASDLVAANALVKALAEQNKNLVRGPKAIADAAGNVYGKAVDLKLGDAATSLARVMNLLQAADVAATATQRAAISAALKEGREALAKWNALKTAELVPLNAKLRAAGMSPIVLR